ncbi:MAG: hypothetical protein ACOCXN_10685 [Spirochaetota bacterium]
MTPEITPRLAHGALRIVFGEDSPLAANVFVLATLSQRELAARFRARALDLHPDRASATGRSPEILERAFKRLHGAYRVLSRLLEDEPLRRHVLDRARSAAGTRAAADGSAEGGLWTPDQARRAGQGTSRTRAGGFAWTDRTAGAAEPGTDQPGAGVYYSGRVPETELRFVQFLYYHRVIDWRTMIDAITWQYRVRPKMGEIGRAYEFMSFEGVTKVLRASPQGELFGSTALRLGLLDRRQLQVVLGKQYRLNYPIGRYFVEKGILSRPEIDHLLVQHRRHNLKYRRA